MRGWETISNTQCTLYGVGSARVSASGNDVALNVQLGLNGIFANRTQNVYIWVVDTAQTGTGWVQTSTWTKPPALFSSSPAISTATPTTFTFVARDPNGATDIQRVYFVVNTTATTAINDCHGFYDHAANAFALYNDALTAVIGPATPGAAGSIQNSQCKVYGTESSVSASGTDLLIETDRHLLRMVPVVSTDSEGRTHQLIVPYEKPLRLIIQSAFFKVADSAGVAVRDTEATAVSFTARKGSGLPSFSIQITGTKR